MQRLTEIGALRWPDTCNPEYLQEMSSRTHNSTATPAVFSSRTAHAYDSAGHDYLVYADGDETEPFEFTGKYSFADREIWRRLDATLRSLFADGRRSLSVLDAGCGPGTWLRRLALRAREIGFERVNAFGFDISPVIVQALVKKQIEFAIDQQEWLQGYLPVVFLSNYVKYGSILQNELILTGPSFVTPENAQKVVNLLSLGFQ